MVGHIPWFQCLWTLHHKYSIGIKYIIGTIPFKFIHCTFFMPNCTISHFSCVVHAKIVLLYPVDFEVGTRPIILAPQLGSIQTSYLKSPNQPYGMIIINQHFDHETHIMFNYHYYLLLYIPIDMPERKRILSFYSWSSCCFWPSFVDVLLYTTIKTNKKYLD